MSQRSIVAMYTAATEDHYVGSKELNIVLKRKICWAYLSLSDTTKALQNTDLKDSDPVGWIVRINTGKKVVCHALSFLEEPQYSKTVRVGRVIEYCGLATLADLKEYVKDMPF